MRRTLLNPGKLQQGISLIEILVGLAIVSILITSVAPAVREILVRNQVTGQINELSSVIQFARHAAINEQITTVLCPTTNFSTCTTNWDDPKMVFPDFDANGQRDEDEEILAGAGNTAANNVLTGPAGSISFQASGAVATPATLLLCAGSGEDRFARALIISLQGRVKLSQDSDNDDIHEDNSGTPLSCS
ncbi:MAG: GspH/FimT family pseudopilin [Aestuariibacter sp.]